MEPVYRWSKYIEESRVEEWENRLTADDVAYVLEKPVKRTRWQLAVYSESLDLVSRLKGQYGGKCEEIDPESWMPSRRNVRAFQAIKIRDSLLVLGEDDPAALERAAAEHPQRIVLSFPPQLAFGTGNHPTTAGCLRFLCDFAKQQREKPWKFLDLGCGSGILSIAAAKLGAESVVGVEMDAMALEYARDNASRHGVSDQIEFIEDDVTQWIQKVPAHSYDLVAANLFCDLLEAIFPAFSRLMVPDGRLIVSGYLVSQADSIARAAKSARFTPQETAKRGKWMAGCFER